MIPPCGMLHEMQLFPNPRILELKKHIQICMYGMIMFISCKDIRQMPHHVHTNNKKWNAEMDYLPYGIEALLGASKWMAQFHWLIKFPLDFARILFYQR
jgi:hypothetical protein